MSNTKILQINIKSININKPLIEHYINKHQIEIILLQETWLKAEEKIDISGFNSFNHNRKNGYGGVSILTHKKFLTKSYNLNTFKPIEAIETQICNNNQNFTFTSIYIPPNTNNNVIKKHLEKLLNKYDNVNNVIIGGDINAHHYMWNNFNKIDERGSIIADIINNSKFHLLNDGNPTFFQLHNNNYTSAIDITLIKTNIIDKIEWNTVHESLGSDHFPIIIKINNPDGDLQKNKNIINYKKLEIQLLELNMLTSKTWRNMKRR